MNLDTAKMHRVVDASGSLVGPEPDISSEVLVRMYRLMALSRLFDRRAVAAQRQGRLGTYAILEGHEAVQVGSALAFRTDDFIYPAYRQHAVQLARGMPLEVILSYWRGLPNTGWDVRAFKQMIICVPIASHLPHAVGHAYAARQRGEDIVTAAYFGDGATSENDFHSGLNFAGVWRTPTVFICENNLYAISMPYDMQTASETIAQKADAYGITGIRVDGMDVLAVHEVTNEAVMRARNGEGPTLIEAVCYRYGPHATADDPRLYRTAEEEDEWRARDPIARFRAYLEKRELWSDAAEADLDAEGGTAFTEAMASIEAGPAVGRGDIVRHAFSRIPPLLADELHELERAAGEPETEFAPHELWPDPAADPDAATDTKPVTMAEAITDALGIAMSEDASLLLLGQDVGVAGGVFRVTAGLREKFGDERVIDTPINESGIVGAAIGMAVSGSRAVAEIQFEGFVYPAFDQIASHLGRIRFRTQGHVSLPVVLRMPNGAGIGAHEHHCDGPEALFAHVPGLIVVVPSTPFDAKGLLLSALAADDPVVFLEPKVLYRAGREAIPDGHYEIALGKARIRRAGNDLTLVTYGGMVPPSLAAAESVAGEGVSTEVIDLRTVYPWDTGAVMESVEKTGRLLVVQEPQRTGGIAAEVAAFVAEHAGYSLEAPVRRLGATDAPWPQFAIERHALIDAGQIAAVMRDTMAG